MTNIFCDKWVLVFEHILFLTKSTFHKTIEKIIFIEYIMCITLIRPLFKYNTSICLTYKMTARQSSDMVKFKETIKASKHIVILSGAGVSAESGIPTFRGAGGYWRKYQASSLATPEAFRNNPSLVWEFYHYRREVAAKAQPNPVIP